MILSLLLLLLLLPQTINAEVRIIELQHRPASELVEPVRALLDAEEKVEPAGRHLVLVADGESLTAAESLIKLLDRKLANLVIQVQQRLSQQQVASEAGGAIRLGNRAELSGSGGLRLGNSKASSIQSLRVIEGSRGLLEIGRDIPYTRQWSALIGDISGYSAETAYQSVDTGFWVLPVQVQGDLVLVEIEPYLAGVAANNNGQAPVVNTSQLKTRLQLPLGEWISLGRQIHQDNNSLSRAIIAWRSKRGDGDQEFLLRIDLAEGFSP